MGLKNTFIKAVSKFLDRLQPKEGSAKPPMNDGVKLGPRPGFEKLHALLVSMDNTPSV